MHDQTCPRCGSHDLEERVVNDRFKACDAAGNVFEVALREPVLACRACRMCWEGAATRLAKETAYREAIARRQREVHA